MVATKPDKQKKTSPAPIQSKFANVPGFILGRLPTPRIIVKEPIIAKMQIGILPKNIQRQDTYSRAIPAYKVPTIMPILPTPVITPSALPRTSEGNNDVARAGAITKRAELPTACSTLNPTTD